MQVNRVKLGKLLDNKEGSFKGWDEYMIKESKEQRRDYDWVADFYMGK